MTVRIVNIRLPPLAAFAALLLTAHADDEPRTIITKDHQKYEQALISSHDATGVTITFDAGIARIPIDQLPKEIYEELGYARADSAAKKGGSVTPSAEKTSATDEASVQERIKNFGLAEKLDRSQFPYELSDYISYYNEMADHINNSVKNGQTEFVKTDQTELASRKSVYEGYRSYIASEADKSLEDRTRKSITQKIYFPGMDEAAVKVIAGVPQKINTTRDANHVIEEFVYGNGSKFLKFIDGKLASE